MADHSKPLVTSAYADFVTELDSRFDDVTLWLDSASTSPTNLPSGAKRWNSTSNKWEKWNGTAWSDLASAYAINLAGPITLTASSASDALRITQTGGGNALVVEDEANPDSSPFIVTANGTLLVGTTTSAVTDKARIFGNLCIGDQQDIAPAASPVSQLVMLGNGYNGMVGLDSTGMYIGANSPSRGMRFLVDETPVGAFTNNGNFAIGSTTADSKFTVYGTTGVSNFISNSYGNALIRNNGASATNATTLDFSSGSGVPVARIGMLYTGSGSLLSFGTSNNYASGITNRALTIDQDGRVAVGATPSGTYQFETTSSAYFGANTYVGAGFFRTVGGGSESSPSIQPGNDADTGMYWVGTNQIGFAAGGSNVFNISTGGAWASGATPSLSAIGTSNSYVSAVSGSYSLALTQYATGQSYCQTNGGPFYLGTTGSQQISFRTNSTEVMTLTSGGYLLIGTTSPSTSVPGIWGGYPYANANGYGRLNFIKGSASGTGSTPTMQFYYNGTTVGSIGNTSTATAYNTSSDYRLKEDVQPMTGALEKLALVKPVTFKWKSNGEAAQGFIAHELQEVFPDAVSGVKDATEMVKEFDDEGRLIGQKEVPLYQGVDSSFLVATLVKAIQELKSELDVVKSKIN